MPILRVAGLWLGVVLIMGNRQTQKLFLQSKFSSFFYLLNIFAAVLCSVLLYPVQPAGHPGEDTGPVVVSTALAPANYTCTRKMKSSEYTTVICDNMTRQMQVSGVWVILGIH